MVISLRDIRVRDGEKLDFAFEMPIPDLGTSSVTGEIRNRAGALTFEADIRASLSLICDRCAQNFDTEKTLHVSRMIAKRVDNAESDDILVVPGSDFDIREFLLPEFLVEMEMKILCRPDCKGLCMRCGTNLNQEQCDCDTAAFTRLT